VIALVSCAIVASFAAAQQPPPTRQRVRPAVPPPRSEHHGEPPGWKFTLPKGDPAKGREVFAKLECFKCHEVKGQSFPTPSDPANAGPELASMASHHAAEFIAESIVNPNAVIDDAKFRASNGSSKMPSFNDSINVQELVDLVAFLKSLTPPAGSRGHGH
jgi:mono/diheme cytochrome c family protein